MAKQTPTWKRRLLLGLEQAKTLLPLSGAAASLLASLGSVAAAGFWVSSAVSALSVLTLIASVVLAIGVMSNLGGIQSSISDQLENRSSTFKEQFHEEDRLERQAQASLQQTLDVVEPEGLDSPPLASVTEHGRTDTDGGRFGPDREHQAGRHAHVERSDASEHQAHL